VPAVGILRKKVNWVLDADIRGFFDTIDHGWLMKFVEHPHHIRIAGVDRA
jgi:retron-type reverse transcriptase